MFQTCMQTIKIHVNSCCATIYNNNNKYALEFQLETMAWISRKRIKEIDREIENIYRKTQLKRYPEISITELVKKYGLDVFLFDFGEDSNQIMGAIDFRGENNSGKPVIYLNRYKHPNNRQFTLAHELGHYILGHRKGNVRFRIDFESDSYPEDEDLRQEELEANYFAGALLMPEDILRSKLKEDNMSTKTVAKKINELKKYFRVSESALKTRLQWIGRNNPDIWNLLENSKPN